MLAPPGQLASGGTLPQRGHAACPPPALARGLGTCISGAKVVKGPAGTRCEAGRCCPLGCTAPICRDPRMRRQGPALGGFYLHGAKTGFAPQCSDACRCPPAPLSPAGSPPAALSASPGEQRQLQEGAASRREPALPFGMRSSGQAGGLWPPTQGWQEPVPGVSHPDMPVPCWGPPTTLGSWDLSHWTPLCCEALPGSQRGSGHGTAAKPQQVASCIATCLVVPASDELQIIHKLLESLILSKEALGTAWNILLLLEVQVLHLPQDGGELQDTTVETAPIRKTQNVSQQPRESQVCIWAS